MATPHDNLTFCPGRQLAGLPYASAMRLRNWGYQRGLLRSESVAAPVVCVGNVTLGGTGKTPMVAWVIEQLRSMHPDAKPAILTRGYKSRDGKSDEAELLAKLTGATVVIDPRRVAGAKRAIADGATLLVMDDGFQHRQLRRDLDIVLIDATHPFGQGACLPLGRLREPLSALARAGAIVITRSDQVPPGRLGAIRALLGHYAPDTPLAAAIHAPTAVLDETGTSHGVETLAGRAVHLVSGIGNPGAFRRTVEALGGKVVAETTFPDHAHYEVSRFETLVEKARQQQALVLTTQKDYVKLADWPTVPAVWQLAITIQFTAGRDALLAKLAALV